MAGLQKAGANVDGERELDREAELAVQSRPEQRAWSWIKSGLASVLRAVDTVTVSIPGLLRVTFRPERDATEESRRPRRDARRAARPGA